MPKHSADTQINATPEQIWQIVTNGERLTDWLSPIRNVEKVEPQGPLAKGTTLAVTIGNVGGAKIKIKEAEQARKLRWTAGPFMAHMMRMPMRVELNLEPRSGGTRATITFKTNPMIAPLMRMMTGLNFGQEAPATAQRLKQAAERN